MSRALNLSKSAALVGSDGKVPPAGLSTGAPTWDSAARLGVNATPNTNWPTNWSVAEWQGGNTVWGVQGQFQVGYNNYYDGTNYRFKATGNRALRYIQTDSGHYWDTSASGTAGAVATFETQMQLGHQQSLALLGASPQSGTGITFPATQNQSSNANTLDDYEEGTWTPVIYTESGSSFTISSSDCRYQKVGNKVFVQASINYSAKGSQALAYVTLPFVASVQNNLYLVGSCATPTANNITDIALMHYSGGNTAYFRASAVDTYYFTNISFMASSGSIRFMGEFITSQ